MTASQSEPKHTPGPWRVERSPNRKVLCVFGGAEFDTWICGELQANNHTRIDTSECLANANLIAAAPDLLAELKSAVAILTENGKLVFDGVHGVAVNRMKAAIAKAEGQS